MNVLPSKNDQEDIFVNNHQVMYIFFKRRAIGDAETVLNLKRLQQMTKMTLYL